MATTLIVHIGVQKSGTSFLQHALAARSDQLSRHGIAYPLEHTAGTTVVNHERATYGLLAEEYPWVTPAEAARHRAAWQTVRKEVQEADGTVLLSAEALSTIRRPAAEALLETLDVEDVRVVVTARDLGALIASFWQQHIRNGRAAGLETYLSALARLRASSRETAETDRDHGFWRAVSFGGLAERWGSLVGHDRVRIVTTPGSPPEVLWTRFLEAIDGPDLTVPAVSSLERLTGMTMPEARLMAAVNRQLNSQEIDTDRARLVRARILADGFPRQQGRGPRISVPPAWHETVAQWSDDDLGELMSTGVRIVGDVTDLRFQPCPGPDGADDMDAILAAAGTAVVAMLPAQP